MAKKNNPDEEPQDNINNDSDDTFGLPEVEYEPLKRDEPVEESVQEPVSEITSESQVVEETSTEYQEEQNYEQHQEQPYKSAYAYMGEEKPSVWPKVILVLVLILVAGSALYYFAYYKPKADKAKAEKILADEARRKEIAAQKAKQDAIDAENRAREQRRADSLANLSKEGTYETLSGRTGKYYVVVASAIDDDLLSDFAGKLVKMGKQVKLIPPFGKDAKFYRLAVDARDTYADAQTAADGMKGGDLGSQLWVVKY